MSKPNKQPESSGLLLNGENGSFYGKRGQKQLRRKEIWGVLVEGELVTTSDIAAKLGVSAKVAKNRLKREQSRAEKVTWAGLATKV